MTPSAWAAADPRRARRRAALAAVAGARGTARRRPGPTSSPRCGTCRPTRWPGAGRSTPRCAPAATARWPSACSSPWCSGSPRWAPPGGAGRPAVRRPLGRPRRCSAGSPWCSSPSCVTLPFAAWRQTVAAPLRAVHPGLGRLDGRPAQVVRGQRGHRRGSRCSASTPWPGSRRAGGGRSGRPARPGWWCCCRSCSRCWSSRCSTSSPRCRAGPAAHRADRDGRPRTGCRCATCWSPTRPGGPRRSTPTSPGSGRPGGSSSTTPCCARRPRPRSTSVVAHELGHAKDRRRADRHR